MNLLLDFWEQNQKLHSRIEPGTRKHIQTITALVKMRISNDSQAKSCSGAGGQLAGDAAGSWLLMCPDVKPYIKLVSILSPRYLYQNLELWNSGAAQMWHCKSPWKNTWINRTLDPQSGTILTLSRRLLTAEGGSGKWQLLSPRVWSAQTEASAF